MKDGDRPSRGGRTGGRRPRCGRGQAQARAEYLGARTQVRDFPRVEPGPASARTRIVAAELVDTSRLWARTAARIEPEWVEPRPLRLVKRSYSEPHWERKRGSAVALEKVTLYGVPLVTDRPVGYVRIDPPPAELFIRRALVEGDWQTNHQFFPRRLLAEAEELEHRVRRRGLVIGEDELFAYDDGASRRGLGRALRHLVEAGPPGRSRAAHSSARRPPERRRRAGQHRLLPRLWTSESPGLKALPLSYAFEPGSQADGVTVDVPLNRLNQLRWSRGRWRMVPAHDPSTSGDRPPQRPLLPRQPPHPLRRPADPTCDDALRRSPHPAGALFRQDLPIGRGVGARAPRSQSHSALSRCTGEASTGTSTRPSRARRGSVRLRRRPPPSLARLAHLAREPGFSRARMPPSSSGAAPRGQYQLLSNDPRSSGR